MTSVLPKLMQEAVDVRTRAHAPYSGYFVGAALEDDRGCVHLGCNVENAAYPEGLCAEAAAIAAMVTAGGRRIRRIAVAGGAEKLTACTPCGGCRQKIREFADPETRVLLLDGDGGVAEFAVDDLLPHSFALEAD